MPHSKPAFVDELFKTLKLVLPITIGLAGQGLLTVTDTAMAGRVGTDLAARETAIAAAALGGSFSVLPFVFGLGLAVSVPVLTAQARGAKRPEDGSAALRHGLFVTLIFGVVTGIAAQLGIDAMNWLGQEPGVTAAAKPYSVLMCWSILPALLFQCFKNHREATGQPWISLLWLGVGMAANVFFNWVFMFGNLGAPELGITGAGVGTLLSRCVMLAGIMAHPGGQPVLWREGICRAWISKGLKLGVPSAFQWTFEAAVFSIATVLVGKFGREQQAAYQIALSLASFAYMVPVGLSQGASIRTGEAFGAKNPRAMRQIAGGAILFSVVFMGLYSVVTIVSRNRIPGLFLENYSGVDAAATSALAVTFIAAAGAFALFDGVQVVAGGILRGMNDVTYASISSFVCFWLLGLPAAYLLAFPADMRGLGVWLGLGVGVFSASVAYGGRMLWKLRRIKFH